MSWASVTHNALVMAFAGALCWFFHSGWPCLALVLILVPHHKEKDGD